MIWWAVNGVGCTLGVSCIGDGFHSGEAAHALRAQYSVQFRLLFYITVYLFTKNAILTWVSDCDMAVVCIVV